MEKSITPAELRDLLASGQEIALLDVRRKDDFDKNPQTLAGAWWRAPAEVDRWLPTIPAGREVVVYCVRGGSVSRAVQQRLADAGCKVCFVEGGLEALQRTGGE